MARILVVDDDPEIAGLVKGRLAAAGFAVDVASTGRGALTLAMHARHDAIVLDRMMPDLDGLSVLKALRAARVTRPVLLLSALGAVDQRVEGLRAGADDYLAKPFSTEELIARLEVLLRRAVPEANTGLLSCADLVLDPERMIARRGARVLDLKRRAFQMLAFLAERQGRVVTRAMLLEGVWQVGAEHDANLVDVHVSRLRAVLHGPREAPLLHTVRGVGYVLSEEPRV
ncbi:MAG: response regulator transcription factor [Paracoccaceae bacterium]